MIDEELIDQENQKQAGIQTHHRQIVQIEKANGGFIVTNGGYTLTNDKKQICTTVEELFEIIKKRLE